MEEEGYDRNVVVLTQPKGYVKEKNKLMPLIHLSLKDYPLAIDAMAKRHLVYNHQVREVERKEKNGEVFVLRPPQALGIGRTEKDPNELRRVYELGRSEALKHLDEIRDFLSGKTEIKKEDMASRKKIRRHYHFIGTVQGVGFRFQAMMAADQLGLTGAEISINNLPAGAGVPFVHTHKKNEEIYIILSGKGSAVLDGEKVDFAAGDVIRVAPAVKRQFSAAADSPVSWACIQVRENSLEEYTAGDAVIG